ncbi:MAG TPA: putative zinc-binding metallopeptidase [Cellvibrionaceae bacterium]
MKTFSCSCKGRPKLFFESTSCCACGSLVGITDDFKIVQSFTRHKKTNHYFADDEPRRLYKKCKNFLEHDICNGMIDIHAKTPDGKLADLCFSCKFNDVVPNLKVAEHLPLWQKMETAKRRALFTLKSLPLALYSADEKPRSGLTFNFLVDRDAKDHFISALPNQEKVLTGHDNGQITINLAEADDVARSKTRLDLHEPYRTLLGHFRHELGHYYFDQLIASNKEKHRLCKLYFGDDSVSYKAALKRHYASGPPSNWRSHFISEYATMHPWEDWAETWAHYMHIIDTLETIDDCRLRIDSPTSAHFPINTSLADTPFADLLDKWMVFSVALNSINRSMGLQDAYPFVLTRSVRKKLMFIHHAIFNTPDQLPAP